VPVSFLCNKIKGEIRMKIDLAKDMGLAFNHTKMPEWTQDCVAERDIIDGVIIADDRSGRTHYIKIIEIIPINFAIMTEEDQDTIINKYAGIIKTGPEDFHIKVVTDIANLDDYVTMARNAYKKEKNENCKKMINDYISFLLEEGGMESYKTHYYFIFELSDDDKKGLKSEEAAIDMMHKRTSEIRAAFRATRNEAILLDPDPATEKKLLARMLYGYYNRRSKEYEPFESRVKRIKEDKEKIKKLLPEMAEDINFDMKNLIAPRSIDFCESPSYVVIDGMYKSHFFVRGKTIPNYMSTIGGWFNSILRFGYGYDIDVYFQKADSDQRLESLKRNLKVSSFLMSNTVAEAENADEVKENYSGQMYMKKALKGSRESVYDMSVLITVWAHTKEELKIRKEAMQKAALRLDVDILECKRFQEEAFYSTGYTMELRPKLYNVARRNLTTSGVAASYPFTSFSLVDDEGIALGYHRENRSLVMFDPFDSKYPNANMCIFGRAGAGKTFSLMTLITRLRYHGIQNFVLAPEKQHEFLRIVDEVDGQFIDLASTSVQRINPLEIIPMESPEMSLLQGDDFVEKAWMIDKCDALKTWFRLLVPDITPAEIAIIDTLLVELYDDFGITSDNDSIFADKSHTRTKRMPIISDLYNKVKENVEEGNLRRDIADILSKFIKGSCRNMNGETNVDLTNKFIVFGLQNIEKDMLPPTMFIILQFVWARSRQNIAEKKMITMDEGWKLLKGSDRKVAEFVEEIYKVIRGYGGGAIFATQSISDLLSSDNDYGNAILANSPSKIILGMERRDLDMIAPTMGLNNEERSLITTLARGEALFCANTNHIPIEIKASNSEYQLFTTSRKDKEKMLKQMKREGKDG